MLYLQYWSLKRNLLRLQEIQRSPEEQQAKAGRNLKFCSGALKQSGGMSLSNMEAGCWPRNIVYLILCMKKSSSDKHHFQ